MESDVKLQSLSHAMVLIEDPQNGKCLLIEPQNSFGKSYILKDKNYIADAVLSHLRDNGLTGFQYNLQIALISDRY